MDKIDNKKIKELEKLSEPIIEWLLKNYDCMCKVIIQDGKIEVVRDEMCSIIETKMDNKINVSAKEMFEKAGYYETKDTGEEFVKVYIENKDYLCPNVIQFTKNKIVISEEIHYDVQLLQAINKQIEELGWK